MATLLQKLPSTDCSSIPNLLGLWAMFLAVAAVAGLVTGDAWVFLCVGFFAPALLAAALAFAVVNVALFVFGIAALWQIASWAYQRHLRDRFRFHLRGWTVRGKGGPKVEERRRTAWGLLADALSGLAVGLGFGAFICAPFVATLILGDHPPTGLLPWLRALGGITLMTGIGGVVSGMAFRIASDPVLVMTRTKAATLPPPLDDEYFETSR